MVAFSNTPTPDSVRLTVSLLYLDENGEVVMSVLARELVKVKMGNEYGFVDGKYDEVRTVVVTGTQIGANVSPTTKVLTMFVVTGEETANGFIKRNHEQGTLIDVVMDVMKRSDKPFIRAIQQ